MEIKYKKKTYIYDQEKDIVLTMNGRAAKNQESIKKAAHQFINSVQARGFNMGLDYEQFSSHISILNSEEKEELFHNIYSAYLYVGEWINGKGVTQTEFYKGMAKIKRYEKYLYIIIQS